MTNEELRQQLIEKIEEERAGQEKRFAAAVIFYFLILLSTQFCIQRLFPIFYKGILFRSIFLIILAATLIMYFVLKKTVLMKNNGYKNALKNTFYNAGFTDFDFNVKKDEIIDLLEANTSIIKDRNIDILHKNLKSF